VTSADDEKREPAPSTPPDAATEEVAVDRDREPSEPAPAEPAATETAPSETATTEPVDPAPTEGAATEDEPAAAQPVVASIATGPADGRNERRFEIAPFHSWVGLVFVTILLVIKLVVSIVNNSTYDVRLGYDEGHHAWRARSAGLEMGDMAYNPPLYYLPALPDAKLDRFYKNGKPRMKVKWNKKKAPEAYVLMERLQALNLLYLFVFYVSWIYGVFPRVLKDGRLWLLASTLLLAMPGYQRLAANVHPDNLLTGLTGLCAVLAVRIAESGAAPFSRSLLMALLSGFIGMTRPFAIVPIAAFWAINVRSILHATMPQFPKITWPRVPASLVRIAAVTAIIAVMSGSWWGYRWAMTGRLVNVYRDAYMENYLPLQKGLDRVHYYTSFYYSELLEKPNRTMAKGLERSYAPLGNSFHTLVYSELWNDHWLVFSGRGKNIEAKAEHKRRVLQYALPVTALLGVMFFVGQVKLWREALRKRSLASPALWLAGVAVVGWAIFVWWQGGAGLTPGKNSGVKFIYVAYVWPFMITTCMAAFRPGKWVWPLLAVFFGLFVVTFPLALYKL
jgi:hypothetical protein